MALVDSTKRYDCYISHYGGQSLKSLGFPFQSNFETMEKFAIRLFELLTQHATRLPSVFLRSKQLMERRDEAFDAVLQLRGGGVGLVLLTEEYFNNKNCMAELHFLLELARMRDDPVRSAEAIALQLVCLEPSYGKEKGLEKINFLLHEINRITAPSLFLEGIDEFEIHNVEGRTNPLHAVGEIASRVWRYWNEHFSCPNLGEDRYESFYDMQRFFVASDGTKLADLLQVEHTDCSDVADVINKARKQKTIDYSDVRKLARACRRCHKNQDAIRAVRAYERKWCGSTWSWDRSRARYQSYLQAAGGIVQDMKVYRKDLMTNSMHIPGVSSEDIRHNDLFQVLSTLHAMTASLSTVFVKLCGNAYIFSVAPERIHQMSRRISSPHTWSKYLNRQELRAVLGSATLSEHKIFSKIWGPEFEEEEKRKVIKLLCECDLLMCLRDTRFIDGDESCSNLYGIPYLISPERNFSIGRRPDDYELEIVTQFENELPKGLSGGLVSYLSGMVHERLQGLEMLGRNSARLKLKQGERIIVTFKPDAREILWSCLSRDPMALGVVCLEKLSLFCRYHLRSTQGSWRSVVLCDCDTGGGCGASKTIKVDFSLLSGVELHRRVARCEECTKAWRVSDLYQELMSAGGEQSVFGVTPRHHLAIPRDMVDRISSRVMEARACFGQVAVLEAFRGLSRVIRTGDDLDFEKFGMQLRECDVTACSKSINACDMDQVPCFAVSYVQEKPQQGRFKFSNQEWDNLRSVLRALSLCGIDKCRLWLDQCWWLRDSVEVSMAPTGLLPYVIWPGISLGDKAFGSDRTTSSYERVWPFVEEIAGLWSLGVITARERRGRSKEDGCRESVSFNHREQLKPNDSIRLVMLNIYHGATDKLRGGWPRDEADLREMATWNVESGLDKVVVGPDWKMRSETYIVRPLLETVQGMALRRMSENFRGEYLDLSRKWICGRWHGLREWISGNERSYMELLDSLELRTQLPSTFKIKVETDAGEFQLLGIENNEGGRVWLLVAMEGRTIDFSRGKVKWTKVVHGRTSCILSSSSSPAIVELVLREQLDVAVKVMCVVDCSEKAIEWT